MTQKEYNNRDDWVGKAIHWELFKRLKKLIILRTIASVRYVMIEMKLLIT